MVTTISTHGITKDTRSLHRCQRCGGQILNFSDDSSCLQCGAPHTEEGELLRPAPAQELSSFLPGDSSEIPWDSEVWDQFEARSPK